ncbi:MAG TPA: cupin domain-containing protein [Polyangiaceae bacterium]|nr:cupin domain-containing protein [Polyangiaceae bacterium]
MQVVDLEPGDLLCLPRGAVHCAATADGASAHVTLGVTVFTWVELAAEILQAGKNVPAFREALPAGFARRPELRAALREGLLERVDALRGSLDSIPWSMHFCGTSEVCAHEGAGRSFSMST